MYYLPVTPFPFLPKYSYVLWLHLWTEYMGVIDCSYVYNTKYQKTQMRPEYMYLEHIICVYLPKCSYVLWLHLWAEYMGVIGCSYVHSTKVH